MDVDAATNVQVGVQEFPAVVLVACVSLAPALGHNGGKQQLSVDREEQPLGCRTLSGFVLIEPQPGAKRSSRNRPSRRGPRQWLRVSRRPGKPAGPRSCPPLIRYV
jgi:hypothetical protein